MTAGMPADGWGAAFASASVPAMTVYAEVMVPRIFEPWAHVLLARLAVEPGEAVLDVACGPGSVTRLAAARSGSAGRVTGCDVSPAMLMIADGLGQVTGGASIDYRQASAECLPVPDEEFDVVCCQQGLQFFPDRQAALAEMRRALRPGGRIGIAVWKHIEQSRPFAILETAIRKVAGAQIADRYLSGPWGLPDAGNLHALLSNAGFADITVTGHELAVTFEAGGDQLVGTLAASGVASELEALPAQDKARLRAVVTELSRPLQDDGGALRSHLASNLVIARR
jgi:SAM-dependent methyltransferase